MLPLDCVSRSGNIDLERHHRLWPLVCFSLRKWSFVGHCFSFFFYFFSFNSLEWKEKEFVINSTELYLFSNFFESIWSSNDLGAPRYLLAASQGVSEWGWWLVSFEWLAKRRNKREKEVAAVGVGQLGTEPINVTFAGRKSWLCPSVRPSILMTLTSSPIYPSICEMRWVTSIELLEWFRVQRQPHLLSWFIYLSFISLLTTSIDRSIDLLIDFILSKQ